MRIGTHLWPLGTTYCVLFSMLCRLASFAAVVPEPATTLTNVGSVLKLTPDRAATELPVHLRATVTYADGPSGILFVEDDTGGIFVGTKQALPALSRGAVIDIQGRSDAGLHLPAISRASIQTLGQTRRLVPARPKFEEIVSGQYDCRFLELQGVVRSVGESRGKATLMIESGGIAIEARFSRLTRTNLWDAQVRVRGVCGLRGMKEKRVISVILYCAGDDAITVERGGFADPFAAPARDVRSIGAGTDSGRVRIDARVAKISGGILTLEDGSGRSVAVEAPAQTMLRAQDRIQVSAVPLRANDELSLRYVELRAVAPAQPEGFMGPGQLAPMLTHIADVRRLGEAADSGFPVRIRGVVTFYDREWLLFVQDSSSGIYVYPGTEKFNIRPGQWVEVEGFTDSGLYAPVIYNPRFTVLDGSVPLPQARSLLPDVLLRGQHDSLRVEVGGIVSSMNRIGDKAELELVTSAGRIPTVLLLTNAILPTNLVNAEVRVRGVCGSTFNQRRQFTGARLLVASASDIIVDRAAPADPFLTDAQPIASLMKFGSRLVHRVKVAGIVTFTDPRKSLLCVQDESGGAFVRVQDWNDIEPGMPVEVMGFPVAGDYTPQMIEGVVRASSRAASISPREIRAAAASSGKHDSELITIEARLLDCFTRGTNDVLVLQAGDVSFEAEKAHQDEPAWLSNLEAQSILKITGVCVVLVNQSSAPRHFRLLLRSPEDVVVLSAPSIWSDGRFRTIAGASVLLVLMPVVWVALLRKKVQQQTAIIRAQLTREQRYSDELEQKVRDRTSALSEVNEQLRRAHDDLESRVEERTQELSRANRALQEEIAERQRSEQALRISDERFQLVARATNDAIWDCDLKTRQLWWGAGFETLFGYRRHQIEADLSSWTGRLHPEDHDRVLDALRRLLETGGVTWADEYRFRCADGSYRNVFDRGYVIRDESGVAARMLGAMVDISPLKQAEESLRLSEERFSKAFRCSPTPMGISTMEKGQFLDVNEALAQALGYGREEMLASGVPEASVWGNPEDRLRALETLREEKPVRNWQVELRTKTGEVRHALASVEKIVIKDVACLLILFHDVTERVQLEAQFRQAQKMEAVGQLAAGIAHDFNNMLTVIHGHVGLLLSTTRDEEQMGSLLEVSRAADRAAGLTRQLLTFSRRQPIMPRTLDLNQVISNTSEMLRRILGEQINLSFRHAASLPAVHADQGMIEQIILNLAVNARDAMPNGGRLEFATSTASFSEDYLRRNADAAPGEFVCMTVADTGCGMDAGTLSRVFEPFFTTKEVGKGTGLGLATVYGIVKQHGGWIELSSEVGHGTKFDIYFPVKSSASHAAPSAPVEPPVLGGNETILVVEDETNVRELASNVLRRYGYDVLSAANGTEALQTWRHSRDRIDLLLTDMVMPEGLSGRDLAVQLRADAPDLKVIYTSGYSVELENGDVALKTGVNFLPKPYPARKLAATVRTCLDV